jgi:membrane protease YdiL (CAAX protease family)
MPSDNKPLYPEPQQATWLKTAWQSFGYFMLYFIAVSVLALLTTSFKFYTAETGFHYKKEDQAAVETFITDVQQKYNLSDSEFLLQQTTGKYNTLVVKLTKPTPEHDNELLIYDLHNNELLIIDYDKAYKMDNQSSMTPKFIGLYALLSLLIYIFWRKKFGSYEASLRPTSTWSRTVLSIAAWVTGLIILLQIYSWLLYFMDIKLQSDVMQLRTMFISQPIHYLLMVVLLAPIQEELVFRGIMLRLFINQKQALIGTLWTSALFAALHQLQLIGQPLVDRIHNFVFIFALSLMLSHIYLKYRHIAAPIFAHALFNLIMTGLLVGFTV